MLRIVTHPFFSSFIFYFLFFIVFFNIFVCFCRLEGLFLPNTRAGKKKHSKMLGGFVYSASPLFLYEKTTQMKWGRAILILFFFFFFKKGFNTCLRIENSFVFSGKDDCFQNNQDGFLFFSFFFFDFFERG